MQDIRLEESSVYFKGQQSSVVTVLSDTVIDFPYRIGEEAESLIIQVNKDKSSIIPRPVDNDIPKDPHNKGLLTIGEFSVEIVADDVFLTIELENQKTGQMYFARLACEDIAQRASSFITTPYELRDHLISAIKGEDKTSSIEINCNAEITLRIQVEFGNRERLVPFIIQTQRLAHVEGFQKSIQVLKESNAEPSPVQKQILQVIEKIVEHNSQVEKNIAQSMERLQVIEKQGI